jgi:hypothetical protein
MRRPGAVTPTQSASAVVAVAVIVLALGALTVAAAVLPGGRERGPVGLFSGAGPPYQLIVTGQPPPSTAAGSKFDVTVSVEDQLGQVVTTDSSTSVLLAITPGTGAAGAGLTCDTNPVTDVYGLSTFSCSIGTPGGNYQLTATGGGLISAISDPFTVASGTATKLALQRQPPSRWRAGSAIVVRVDVEDSSDDVVTTSSTHVTLAISRSSRDFKCSKDPVGVIEGVATFTCRADLVGAAFRLTASAPGLQSAVSAPFTVVAGRAIKLTFTREPPNSTRVGAMFSVLVAVEDAYSNLVGTSRLEIRASLLGGARGELSCRLNPVRASGGRARFVCEVAHPVRHVTLGASGQGVTPARSAPFSVVSG